MSGVPRTQAQVEIHEVQDLKQNILWKKTLAHTADRTNSITTWLTWHTHRSNILTNDYTHNHDTDAHRNNSLKAVRNVVPIFHTLTIILDVSVPPIRHTSTMVDTSAPPTSHLSHHSEVFAEIPLVTYHWKNQCNCDNHDSFHKFQTNILFNITETKYVRGTQDRRHWRVPNSDITIRSINSSLTDIVTI